MIKLSIVFMLGGLAGMFLLMLVQGGSKYDK